MKILKMIISLIKNKPLYPTWDSMPDGLLFFFFVSSSLPASYWSYVVTKLYEPYIDAFNQAGFTLIGMVVTFVMLVLAFNAWFFACISARSGQLIFERWFK